MKNILEHLEEMEKYLSKRYLCLFLDYDGTLAPISDKPKNAILDPSTRVLLKKLSKLRNCHIYIISGRALADVKEMVSLDNVGYVGNHGIEMDAPRVVFGNFDFSHTKQVLSFLKPEIEKVISNFDGAFVENKEMTLSVHYRLVRHDQEELFKQILLKIIKPFIDKDEIRTTFGKKVLEIRPPLDWDKGEAVLWLMSKHEGIDGQMPAAIYIGDDRTDEDAFRALKGKGMIIKVGVGKSIADYYLREQGEINAFLKIILRIKQRGWVWNRLKI